MRASLSQAQVQVALVLASTQVGLPLSHKSDGKQNTEMSGIQSKTGIVLRLMHFRFIGLDSDQIRLSISVFTGMITNAF